MNVRNAPFVYFEAAALAVVCVLVYIFPGASPVRFVLQLLGVGGITYVAYTHLCRPERAGLMTLLVFWLLLAIGIILNIWYFTTYSGGTDTAPVLHNNDAAAAWNQMMAVLNGTESPVEMERRGYGTFLALLSYGGTPTISSLLNINMLAILLAIVLTGATAAKMTGGDDKRKARVATVAMLMAGGVCYFLHTGAILIKDALCCLIMAMTLYAVYATPKAIWKAPLILAAIAAAALIRTNLLPFIVLAIIIGAFSAPRRQLWVSAAMCLIAVGAYFYVSSLDVVAIPIDTGDATTIFDVNGASEKRLNAYSAVSGDYNYSSNLKKLVLLPFSLAVQFLTPLPWAFGRDIVFGPSEAYAHISYPWYALGCLLFFYLFFRIRRSPRAIASAFAFGVLATVATAFMTGGTVSRYCLPWLPYLVPGAAWLVTSGELKCKAFRRWAWAYGIILATALATVFIFLHIYSPGGWDAV